MVKDLIGSAMVSKFPQCGENKSPATKATDEKDKEPGDGTEIIKKIIDYDCS